MKDIIDERNKREKMEKVLSNIGMSDTHKVKKEMQEPQEEVVDEPSTDLAAELLKKQAEAKRRMVEAAIEEDAIERGKIDKILHEKVERIQNIVDKNGEGF